MTAPKPAPRPRSLKPLLREVRRAAPVVKPRYPGTDSRKWNVRAYSGEVLAKGLDGFKSANEAAQKLGGKAVRA